MWKESFRALGWNLPFPEGITEPAFATLLFTGICTVRIAVVYMFVSDANVRLGMWPRCAKYSYNVGIQCKIMRALHEHEVSALL